MLKGQRGDSILGHIPGLLCSENNEFHKTPHNELYILIRGLNEAHRPSGRVWRPNEAHPIDASQWAPPTTGSGWRHYWWRIAAHDRYVSSSDVLRVNRSGEVLRVNTLRLNKPPLGDTRTYPQKERAKRTFSHCQLISYRRYVGGRRKVYHGKSVYELENSYWWAD